MIKRNKILEALIRVKNRIETRVVHLKRSDEKYKIEYYDVKGVNKVLQEEINKAIREE